MTRDERIRELDELIAGGWGDVAGNAIPEDWRDGPPAVRKQRMEHQAAVARNMARKASLARRANRDSKRRRCFICQSPGRCIHRERELRGVREFA